MPMLTLACPIATRDSSLEKDSKLVNCYWEASADGKRTVVKRPGYELKYTFPEGKARGSFYWNNFLYFVIGGRLCSGGADGSSGFQNFPLGYTDFGSVSMGISKTTSGHSSSVFMKTRYDLWSLSETGFIHIPARSFPATEPTTPHCVSLDGTFYVMENPGGRIYGSALSDPLTWNALNFIQTDDSLGEPVALERHLNYIAAFFSHGVQFFYNAGNPSPGSPLLPSGNTLANIGCASQASIQKINGLLIFMSRENAQGRSISAFSGLSLQVLSTPAIDKILLDAPGPGFSTADSESSDTIDLADPFQSFTIKTAGQSFYILTVKRYGKPSITLCLNLVTMDWSQWTSSADGVTETGFVASDSTVAPRFLVGSGPTTVLPQTTYLLDSTKGLVYSMSGQEVTDAGNPILALIRTKILDHDSTSRKFLPSISLVGDTVASSVQVRYSDDDYTTFSAYRPVDMSKGLRKLTRLGSFYRRSFDFLHTAATPLRLEGMIIPDSSSPGVTQPELE